MKAFGKHPFLVIFCGLATLVALFWPSLPMASNGKILASIPMEGFEFQSHPLELSDEDKAFLAGAEAIQRIVRTRSHGSVFVLSVIDGSGNRHAVHDPQYCLVGGGWKIAQSQQVVLISGVANLVQIEKDGQTTEAMWFFDDGTTQFTSPLEYWWRTSLRRATRGLSGTEPVLVMLRIPPGSHADWQHIRQVILPALGFR